MNVRVKAAPVNRKPGLSDPESGPVATLACLEV